MMNKNSLHEQKIKFHMTFMKIFKKQFKKTSSKLLNARNNKAGSSKFFFRKSESNKF